MLYLLNENNKLKEYLDTLKSDKGKTLKWTRINANNTVNGLPLLDLQQINAMVL